MMAMRRREGQLRVWRTIRCRQGFGGMCLVLGVAGPLLSAPLPWQDQDLPHEKRQHVRDITTGREVYRIRMDGTVDMDHAMTRDSRTWHVGWQPNESLTIENTGTVPIENAKVIINDRGDWYTPDSLLREAIGSARSAQEKVYLIWQFSRSNRHHDDPIFGTQYSAEMHDPVKMLMIYGAGLCDDSGSFGAMLFSAAGFNNPQPFVRCLHGHMMCEVFAEKRWQFMDIDEDVFYLDRENELPVGGDDVARDHDLAMREFHYGPAFEDWGKNYSASSLFGRDDGRATILVGGYQLRVNLRPHERIEYRWDNIGKWASEESGYPRRWVGNSRVVFEPPLARIMGVAESARHMTCAAIGGEPALAADSADGELVYRMGSGYTFCGGHVTASFALRGPTDRAVIEAWAKDNRGKGQTGPVKVWEASEGGLRQADVEIDSAISPTAGPPKYEFWVCVRLSSGSGAGGAVLARLAIRGDIMVSPLALPRLRLGDNQVVYTDESKGDRKVRVVYRWRETTATTPLPAPVLSYPPEKQVVRDDVITYRWERVAGATAYHLQVCRDEQMRWPYRPSLDVVLSAAQFAVPFWGIYAPDTTFYWRVRTRNDKGIWGEWSCIRTFQWKGPRVPIGVALSRLGETFTLRWQPNPRAERPVAYEVYGSDIKGFCVNRESHDIPSLGNMAGNYLGRTTSTEMVVAGAAAADRRPAGVERPENLNRCYYRVVAVDGQGAHSICSDYAELPHPFVWSRPTCAATIARPYRYEPRVIRDMGDLQYRYEGIQQGFWEQERLSFALAQAPSWLRIDPASGVLSGVPPAGSSGRCPIRIVVTATFEPRSGKDMFKGNLPPRTAEQRFELKVESGP